MDLNFPMLVLGGLTIGINLIQYLCYSRNWKPEWFGYHAKGAIVLAFANVIITLSFLTVMAQHLGILGYLSAIPFGYLFYYNVATQTFFSDSASNLKQVKQSLASMMLWAGILLGLYFLDFVRIPYLGTPEKILQHDLHA